MSRWHIPQLTTQLFVLLAATMSCAACTAMMNYEYFKPQAVKGKLTSSGIGIPKNAIVFQDTDYQVTIYTDPLRRTMETIGPVMLPVIPTPRADEKTAPALQSINTLHVYVTFWLRNGTGEIDLDEMKVRNAAKEELTPVVTRVWTPGFHKFIQISPDQRLVASDSWPSARYDLTYELKNDNLSSLKKFQFIIRDFRINGRRTILPTVTFERTTDRAFSSAP